MLSVRLPSPSASQRSSLIRLASRFRVCHSLLLLASVTSLSLVPGKDIRIHFHIAGTTRGTKKPVCSRSQLAVDHPRAVRVAPKFPSQRNPFRPFIPANNCASRRIVPRRNLKRNKYAIKTFRERAGQLSGRSRIPRIRSRSNRFLAPDLLLFAAAIFVYSATLLRTFFVRLARGRSDPRLGNINPTFIFISPGSPSQRFYENANSLVILFCSRSFRASPFPRLSRINREQTGDDIYHGDLYRRTPYQRRIRKNY